MAENARITDGVLEGPDRLEMMPQIEPARLQLICNNFW